MRPRIKKQKLGSDYMDTYVAVVPTKQNPFDELDPVRVYFNSSPAEPDVNWPGGLEIESIEYEGKDITAQVEGAELDSLAERIEEYLNASAEDERY